MSADKIATNPSINVIEAVTTSVEEILKHATNELKQNPSREKLRTWLSPPDPSINHNFACDSQHDGSAAWFIRGSMFEEWKMNGSMMWIRGNPGSGKSILCSAIIEDIKHTRMARSALIGYYYFDFRDVAKCDLRGLLSSLLTQLCDESDRCWDVLSQLYSVCVDGSEQPSEAALARCLRSILELPGQVPIYIIVDALDECPNTTGMPSAREKVLVLVEDLVSSKHSNLHICVTSRPESDIQCILNPLASGSHRVSLHEEGGQREDVISYVRSFVYNDKAMRRWRPEDKELVIGVLSERANGMFRWVVCQLDTLRRCMPASIRRALDELPITLDETYGRVLKCIAKENRGLAHHLFQCLIAAVRPLRVEELAEISAICFDSNTAPGLLEEWRPEDPEVTVLSACSSLITIVDVGDSRIVQFSHFSVKEFLTSQRLATSNYGISHYYIPLTSAHTILARACLAVLLQLGNNTNKKRLGTFPLAFYAAQHWVDHANFEDVKSQIQDAMEYLFDPMKPHLAAWTWIYDIDRRYERSLDDLAEYPPPLRATPLYYAALCGFAALETHLVVTHAEDVNARCGRYGTPLHAASFRGQLDIIRMLLDHGANLNTRNDNEETPLHAAIDGGQVMAIQLLLQYGADVNARDDGGDGVLHLASEQGQVEALRLLIEHGADISDRGFLDWTPLHNASYRGHTNVAQLLLEYGADVNAQSGKAQDTPLLIASRYGRVEVVQLLLQHGADVHIRGLEGQSPFQAANVNGDHEIAELLLGHGAIRE